MEKKGYGVTLTRRCNVQMMVVLIIILIMTTYSTNAKVTWKTVTKDIMPGMNVTLKCSTLLENVCDGGGRKWKGGKNNTLLVFNEGPVNKKKYSSKCENNGFTLTIIDFRLDDFNQNYTCSYKFDQYTDILRQDSYALSQTETNNAVSNVVVMNILIVMVIAVAML
ncbi:Hypothetical predicted protein [Mytilus galloprovincialis]|uniref:Uncharacterized protein n=1 Tax=Mytilus galloprovincialis TaxID=29158 RepID=A0A8B6HL56_MYTGA|nr:Hypothetical predicted protein [Mytilus galloprovincialis]